MPQFQYIVSLYHVITVPLNQEPTESENTDPWLADNQSRDLNREFWLAVYLIRSVAVLNTADSEWNLYVVVAKEEL